MYENSWDSPESSPNDRRSIQFDNSDDEEESTSQRDQVYPVRKSSTIVSYEIMPGFESGSEVLFCPEEQQFHSHGDYNFMDDRAQFYVCQVDGCECEVYTKYDECLISDSMAHNHGKKTQTYYDLCSLNEMKRILDSVHNKLSAKQR